MQLNFKKIFSFAGKLILFSVFFKGLIGAEAPAAEKPALPGCGKALVGLSKYEWLEKDSPERQAWIRRQVKPLVEKAESSRNYKTLATVAHKRLNANLREKQVKLDDQTTLVLKKGGLGRPQELVLRTSGHEELLMSSHDFRKNGTLNFIDFKLSPRRDFVLVHSSVDGNIDDYKSFIYDLKNKKRAPVELTTSWLRIAWQTDHRFYFYDGSAVVGAKTPLKIFDLENLSVSLPDPQQSLVVAGDDAFTMMEGKKYFLKTPDGFSVELPAKTMANQVVGRNGDKVYLYGPGAHGFGDVVAVDLKKSGAQALSDFVVESAQKVITRSDWRDGRLVTYSALGARQFVDIFDPVKGHVAGFTVPDCCSVSNVQWDPTLSKLVATLTSQVVTSADFTYDLSRGQFVDPELDSKMLTADGQKYETYLTEIASDDGALISVRITHAEKLKRNSAHPAMIYGYGGFNLPGYEYPRFVPMDLQFLSDGGVLAAPTLRGRPEWGALWHEQAMFDHKQNVFNDMKAAARSLQVLGLSRPEKVAIQGWSNGGMVVAATALQSPQSFGLVVAGAGVQDMLRKEYLDPRNVGWAAEYGDSRKPNDRKYIEVYSPVNQAEDGRRVPRTLIFVGQKDSRVNPAHSYKLMAALKDHASAPDVYMMAMKNSGHWVTSPDYQDLIGWRSQVFLWTFVYDYFGMKAHDVLP